MARLDINGRQHTIDAPPDMPLLWALRDLVGLTGTKFGCGMAQCGACTVHLDGAGGAGLRQTPVWARRRAARSPRSRALGATPAGQRVQHAWLELDVAQCGYCQSGQVMSAAALIASNRSRATPTSTPRWQATSAAAARPTAFAPAIRAGREGSLTCRKGYSMHRTPKKITPTSRAEASSSSPAMVGAAGGRWPAVRLQRAFGSRSPGRFFDEGAGRSSAGMAWRRHAGRAFLRPTRSSRSPRSGQVTLDHAEGGDGAGRLYVDSYAAGGGAGSAACERITLVHAPPDVQAVQRTRCWASN